MALVICESAAKIDKINKALGNDYKVMASFGHIIDLDKQNFSIEINGDDYKPIYTIINGKEDIVNKIKKEFKKYDKLILATDKDREGEMIAWSLAHELGVKDPDRIVFTSLTKKDLVNAMKNKTKINYNLVDAQKLRRMLDRIIGYRVSPLLWKSIGCGQLSAGRVQSVAVKLIIEKENEIKNFFNCEDESYFKINGEFYDKNKKKYKSQLYTTNKNQFDSDTENETETETETTDNSNKKGKIAKIKKTSETKKIMNTIIESGFKVSAIVKRESERKPPPPFTTFSLQQEASRKLGFSAKRTMLSAQKLYEAHHITYMRTDSVNLADETLKELGDFIVEKYGKEYYKKTIYKSKSKNAQEAHEACRPTDPKVMGISPNSKEKIDTDEIRLYSLIWKRTISSQMTPAKFNIISIQINGSKMSKEYYFLSQIEQNIFLGYLIVYNLKNKENDNEKENDIDTENNNGDTKVEDIIVPKVGTIVNSQLITASQEYKRPPTRYNEATFGKKIEDIGIGRPATLVSIIDKIQQSGYVKKEDNDGIEKKSIIFLWDGEEKIKEENKTILLGKDQNRFVPTSLGILVNDFLVEYFTEIMEYEFTANMEDQLDEVANGNIKWNIVLDKFYKKFQPLIDKLDQTIKPKEIVDKHERILGNHPESGRKIIATLAKFGPIVKMLPMPNEKGYKPILAPIKKPLTLEKIKLDDALELLKFPINLGKYQKKNVVLNKGKFGFYLKIGDESVSLKLTDKDVEKFNIDNAIEAIEEKNKKILWNGKDDKNKYVVLNGQYGNYISSKPLKGKTKGKTCKLSDDIKIEDLTLEKVRELVTKSYKNKRKFVKKNDNNNNTNNKNN